MNAREHFIEIKKLVLIDTPSVAAIGAAVLRALRSAGLAGAVGEPRNEARVAGEVTQAVGKAVKGGGV